MQVQSGDAKVEILDYEAGNNVTKPGN